MIQNHLLQLLCLVGMEAPLTLDERTLRDRKIDVLRAVRRLSPEEVRRYRRAATARAASESARSQATRMRKESAGSWHRKLCPGHAVGGQLAVGRRSVRVRSGKALGRGGARSPSTSGRCPTWRSRRVIPTQRAALAAGPDRLAFGMNLNRPGTRSLERIGWAPISLLRIAGLRACCSRSWRGLHAVDPGRRGGGVLAGHHAYPRCLAGTGSLLEYQRARTARPLPPTAWRTTLRPTPSRSRTHPRCWLNRCHDRRPWCRWVPGRHTGLAR
jgi:hypothetical protein